MVVVLYKPEVAGNVGAIARLVKNFGMDHFYVIDPCCDVKGKEASDRAKHARDVLARIEVVHEDVLAKFKTVIGTTCRLGTDYNVLRTPLVAHDLAQELKIAATGKDVALLFGCEGTGLPNTVLDKCHVLVTVPTDKNYPSLNLSHSVAILLYECTKNRDEKNIKEKYPLMNQKSREVMEAHIEELTTSIYHKRKNIAPTVLRIWKRILGRSAVTGREGAALIGFFKYASRMMKSR